MKHFRVGKNAQVVVYILGIRLEIVVNFSGNDKSHLFGRTYDGSYAHLAQENLLPDYQAFDDAEALAMAGRAGTVEPLDDQDVSSEEIAEAEEVKQVVEAFNPAPVSPTVDPKLETVLNTAEPAVEAPAIKK